LIIYYADAAACCFFQRWFSIAAAIRHADTATLLPLFTLRAAALLPLLLLCALLWR